MAQTGDRQDPFRAFRFEVWLDDLPVAGFSECTGLQLETEVKEYQEGGQNTYVHKFVTRTKQSNITLKRGIVDPLLWDWYWALVQGDIELKTGTIVVYSLDGNEIDMAWEFRRAFPCKCQGPDLNATQNNVALETFELCHEGLERLF